MRDDCFHHDASMNRLTYLPFTSLNVNMQTTSSLIYHHRPVFSETHFGMYPLVPPPAHTLGRVASVPQFSKFLTKVWVGFPLPVNNIFCRSTDHPEPLAERFSSERSECKLGIFATTEIR